MIMSFPTSSRDILNNREPSAEDDLNFRRELADVLEFVRKMDKLGQLKGELVFDSLPRNRQNETKEKKD